MNDDPVVLPMPDDAQGMASVDAFHANLMKAVENAISPPARPPYAGEGLEMSGGVLSSAGGDGESTGGSTLIVLYGGKIRFAFAATFTLGAEVGA